MQSNYQWPEGAWVESHVGVGTPHLACLVALERANENAKDGKWVWLNIGDQLKFINDPDIYLAIRCVAYQQKAQTPRRTPWVIFVLPCVCSDCLRSL